MVDGGYASSTKTCGFPKGSIIDLCHEQAKGLGKVLVSNDLSHLAIPLSHDDLVGMSGKRSAVAGLKLGAPTLRNIGLMKVLNSIEK
eukprot:CAMPEP_0175849868 /NCGR_PEP_ID=MMETSP0107_2-20121207/24768_1 /TAXON_ID=195067 ORGANISM="Goniomonas pacifica, Strain CCMP1869" /NCGR_SAMPLE_ID=MMETSP0107_2 /ASSEMBLY_ACC=CAM_ASM_000203 /LENGTH=86 /DNA_ID=CAMNT_0017165083 /DNA_START=301 /DNA_END=561 /DNA_ORIENTATION=-